MSFEAKRKAKMLIEEQGYCEVTIANENDQFIKELKFTNFDECVSEVEYQETIGNACYL